MVGGTFKNATLLALHQIKRGSKMDLLIGKGNVSFVPDNSSTER